MKQLQIGYPLFSRSRGFVVLILLAFPIAGLLGIKLCTRPSASAELRTAVIDENARRLLLDDLPAPKNYRPGSVYQCPYFPPRLAPGERLTLLDLNSAGYLTHTWMTGQDMRDIFLSFTFDGEAEPSIQGTGPVLFSPANKVDPPLQLLPLPLCLLPNGAYNSYMPMPFRKGVKVIIENRGTKRIADNYFAFDYILMPAKDVPDKKLIFDTTNRVYRYIGTDVQSLPLPLENRTTLRLVSSKRIAVSETGPVTLAANERRAILTLTGPAVIRRLDLLAPVVKSLELQIRYEGAEGAAIDVPAEKFFGKLNSLAFEPSVLENSYSCFLPMPFQKKWMLVVKNASAEPAMLQARVHYEHPKGIPESYRYLHARFNAAEAHEGEHYHLFDTVGRGHFVGLHLYHVLSNSKPVDHAGALFIYGDAETPYPYAFTWAGGEDYFSAAYFGDGYTTPYVGASIDYPSGGQRYRFHLESPIPFQRSISADFGISLRNAYESVAFWYQDSPMHRENGMRIPWRCIGPFNAYAMKDDMLSAKFPPEDEVDFTKDYDVSVMTTRGDEVSRKARWRKVLARNGFADFKAEYTRHRGGLGDVVCYVVSYALTNLESPRDQVASFLISHDDPLELRVNGNSVARFGSHGRLVAERVKVALKKGKNKIFVKETNSEKDGADFWNAFSFVALDEDGDEIPATAFSAD